MFTKLFLLIAAVFITFTSAGNAIIANRCPYDVWIWSVNKNRDVGPFFVPSRTKFIEPIQVPDCGAKKCGTSLKVSKTNQIVPGFHTQFEYAVEKSDNMLYYDISYVDCAVGQSAANCPGWEMGHAIDSPVRACDRVRCPKNTYCPTQAYFVDYPVTKLGLDEPVFGCGSAGRDMDVHFMMCSEEKVIKRSVAGRVEIDDWA